MRELLIEKLLNRFEAFSDLAGSLDDELLSRKVDVPKHKSLAEHLWCVVGARESYARAIEEGSWDGFACSMEAFGAADYRGKLQDSRAAVETAIRNVAEWDAERSNLLATLAEHEVMHEGQIIRHMYALELELPASWTWA